MKASLHKLVEELIAACGPAFARTQDYDTIIQGMSMVMARVIQATPDRGHELDIFEDTCAQIRHALTEFLKIENEREAQQAAKEALVDQAIVSFDQFARPEQPVIEPGSAGDYPDNPNQNVAKTQAPFPKPAEGGFCSDGEPKEASQEGSAQ